MWLPTPEQFAAGMFRASIVRPWEYNPWVVTSMKMWEAYWSAVLPQVDYRQGSAPDGAGR